MLRSIGDLEGYAIRANDGVIGHIGDFYFDDEAWVVRYLVVEAGTWLESRNVLISPYAVGQADWENRTLPVSLSREQVKNSPGIDTAKPVSRQHEMEHLSYYHYPLYWGGTDLWGEEVSPDGLLASLGHAGTDEKHPGSQVAEGIDKAETVRNSDPHLRSCNAVVNYLIEATDGDIGHVEGMLVDQATWAIRYLIVNTSNWWFGHKVLVVPQWIENVSWLESTVTVNLTRAAVKGAPIFDSAAHLDREMEMDVYMHYGRTGYWDAEGKSEALIARI